MMYPTPGPQLLMNPCPRCLRKMPTMPASESLPGNQREGLSNRSDRSTPEAFRVLDWTNLDSPPTSMDVTRMASLGGRDGAARLAILVNTPRMLRPANVFAEHA